MSERVVLVGCVKGKRSIPSPARDLYVSPLFEARRAYAVASGHRWGILSALYGAVHPDRVIRPYDWTIAQRKTKTGGGYAWAVHVIQDCFFIRSGVTALDYVTRNREVNFEAPLTIEIHAGVDYVDLIREHGLPAWRNYDISIEHPVEGMGIGQQKQWYAERKPEYRWYALARQLFEGAAR